MRSCMLAQVCNPDAGNCRNVRVTVQNNQVVLDPATLNVTGRTAPAVKIVYYLATPGYRFVDQAGNRLDYSSCGPNSTKPKPDFVGLIPFPCSSRERPFAGTSAAAPQGAALAALMWSRYPEWTAAQIREALQAAALDINAPGHDWETGFGLMRLP